MKQEIQRPALIAAIVVAVLVVIFIGWRSFGSHDDTVDHNTLEQHMAAKRAREGDH